MTEAEKTAPQVIMVQRCRNGFIVYDPRLTIEERQEAQVLMKHDDAEDLGKAVMQLLGVENNSISPLKSRVR